MVSEIPNIINEENIKIAPVQDKTSFSVLSDDHCEEFAFPYLFPKGKFGCTATINVALSHVKYFSEYSILSAALCYRF